MIREVIASFTMDFSDVGLDGARDAISGLHSELSSLADSFNFAIDHVMAFTDATVEQANAINQVSAQLGQSTSQVQEWGFLFAEVGLEIDDVGDVIASLQERARDANDSADVRSMFESIGVSVKDSSGQLKDANTLFTDVVQGMSQMENGTDRAGLALTLLGDNGRRLIPILEGGAEGLAENAALFQELGGGLSQEAIQAADDYRLASARLDLGLMGLRSTLAVSLIPAVSWFVEVGTDVIRGLNKMTEGTNLVEAALVVLGAAMVVFGIKSLIAFGPILLTALLVAAAFGVIVIWLDELITTFEGGDTVIKEFIDTLFGVGTTASVVESLKGYWASLVETWSDLPKLWERIKDAFNVIWEAIGNKSSEVWDSIVLKISQQVTRIMSLGARVASAFGAEGLAASITQAATAGAVAGPQAPPGRQGSARVAGAGSTQVDARSTTTQQNTFNIQGSDPAAIRQEVSTVLEQQNAAQARRLRDNLSRRA